MFVGDARHTIVLVDELLGAVEAATSSMKATNFGSFLRWLMIEKHAVMRDRAFLGDQVGARHAIDGLLGQLEVQPEVVGDVHHQRARLDAAEIRVDVVGLADAVAPDEIDGVIELGAVDRR